MSFGDDTLDPTNKLQEEGWFGWIDIKKAPIQAWLKGHQITRVDVLAKCWFHDKDEFEFRRFTDAYFHYDVNSNGRTKWTGVDEGWKVVAYRNVPPTPIQWPPE